MHGKDLAALELDFSFLFEGLYSAFFNQESLRGIPVLELGKYGVKSIKSKEKIIYRRLEVGR